MNYRKAVEYIVKRHRDDKINAQLKYEHLLDSNKKLKDIEDQIKIATLDYIKTNDKTHLSSLEKEKYDYLLKLNISKEDIVPPPHCKICNDTGFVNGKYCDCVKAQAIDDDKNNITLPLYNFKDIDLGLFNDDDKKHIDKTIYNLMGLCEKFPNSIKNTVCLIGGAGTGKTYLASCLCNELLNKHASLIYITAFELVNRCLQYHIDFSNQYDILQKFLDCDVLSIDDLGTESIYKNVTKEYLFQILNERQIKNKLTIITSNLNINEISDRYGDRISSRLFAPKTSFFREFNLNDIRKFKISN